MAVEGSDFIDEFDCIELRSVKIFGYSYTTPCDELKCSLRGSYVANAPVPMMSPR
jgi:hypothetical protein